ncbi:uncharacterized protein EKO05_0004484 [Ascochyta rabiei]|uniref:Uncharacterized protein n=1 Tax=Didymella rabiei TaxID=5454 RepID=A0A163DPP4_DIDRA|nr:uncharacterized protein EKO05_0004484 [Ascochyta rabiei]KZM23293.1 hypothetical protein ST47_g5566 [Ascochyta rabiei]UPX13991.1 hypothetical protein EKO05_0004484 [Ascochyta rabiei]
MWTAIRAAPRSERTSSIHSIGSLYGGRPESVASMQSFSQVRGYDSDQSSETAFGDEQLNVRPVSKVVIPAIWQPQRQEPRPNRPTEQPTQEAQKNKPTEEPVTNTVPQILNTTPQSLWTNAGSEAEDDTESLASTLEGEEQVPAFPEKTPISIPVMLYADEMNDEPVSPAPAPHIPGPLESQLAALMSKLIYIERSDPVVSVEPAEYLETTARLKKLEGEKEQLWRRHVAIWALRDEDLENNIKLRGLLAAKDRQLEAMTALRDEDLVNVQLVRKNLADKTREVERLQAQAGTKSPTRGRPGSFIERRATNDLFAAAKSAALEQRVLELEKRNSDLITQAETLRGGASIDDLNRVTAHQAWKDHVADLEAQTKAKDVELKQRPAGDAAEVKPSASEWSRIEAIVQEHGAYRENVGGKLQALRSEKEALQKLLHAKEDECHTLELNVQSLRRQTMAV